MKRFLVLMALLITAMSFVAAIPAGPTNDITPIDIDRWDTWPGKNTTAIAGNVTEINLDGSSVTRTWQGYYGNVTGKIVLGNSLNQTLYDWDLASPQGRVYAVRTASLPSWSDTRCATLAELQAEDAALGVDEANDDDAVNETFVVTGSGAAQARFGGALSHPTFWVADSEIDADDCAITYLYNETESESQYFREVILSDDGSVPIIYTAFISHTFSNEVDRVGFDGSTHDFQMIVGENGHGTDIATSDYYFYLELE